MTIPILYMNYGMFNVAKEKWELKRTLEQSAFLVDAVKNLSQSIHELQKERGISTVFSMAKNNTGNDLGQQRQQTNLYLSDTKKFLTQILDSAILTQEINFFLEEYKKLEFIRSQVDQKAIKVDELFSYYSVMSKKMIQIVQYLLSERIEGKLGKVLAISPLISYKESCAIERGLINAILTKNCAPIDRYKQLVASKGLQEHLLENLLLHSSSQEKSRIANFLNSHRAIEAREICEYIISKGVDIDLEKRYEPSDWFILQSAKIDQIKIMEDEIFSNIVLEVQQSIFKAKKYFWIYVMFSTGVIFCIVYVYTYVLKLIVLQLRGIRKGLEELFHRNFNVTLEVNTKDELGSLAEFINDKLISHFKEVFETTQNTATSLKQQVKTLEEFSSKLSEDSFMQSNSMKSVLSSLDGSGETYKSITKHIDQISHAANVIQSTTEKGVKVLEDNQNAIEHIKQSNIVTTKGIKTLAEQIHEIWDVINTINSIADQTKIIAFNAELEAAAAGETGKNFQIVASEIRRLADTTGLSIFNIKEKINNIEKSSATLIETSQENEHKVKEGLESSSSLKSIFEDIAEFSKTASQNNSQIYASMQQAISLRLGTLSNAQRTSSGIIEINEQANKVDAPLKELACLSANLDKVLR